VVDYLAEALREMRKHNFTEVIDRHFSMGAHLNARDHEAVRKTVSGLMKILFPHGEVTQDDYKGARRAVTMQLPWRGTGFRWNSASASCGLLHPRASRSVHDCARLAVADE
jgi:hypothetical protein